MSAIPSMALKRGFGFSCHIFEEYIIRDLCSSNGVACMHKVSDGNTFD